MVVVVVTGNLVTKCLVVVVVGKNGKLTTLNTIVFLTVKISDEEFSSGLVSIPNC